MNKLDYNPEALKLLMRVYSRLYENFHYEIWLTIKYKPRTLSASPLQSASYAAMKDVEDLMSQLGFTINNIQ